MAARQWTDLPMEMGGAGRVILRTGMMADSSEMKILWPAPISSP